MRIAWIIGLGLAAACGGRDDCKEARSAAGEKVAAATSLTGLELDQRLRALADLEATRDQYVEGRPLWQHALTQVEEQLGCAASARCCDQLGAAVKGRGKRAARDYFPALSSVALSVAQAAPVGLDEKVGDLRAALGRLEQQMAAGAAAEVKATCDAVMTMVGELRAVADSPPAEPTAARDAVATSEKRAETLRIWTAALVAGKPLELAAADPDAPEHMRAAHKALAVYQAHCH